LSRMRTLTPSLVSQSAKTRPVGGMNRKKAASYPVLEIIAKLARVLEVEPA